MNRCVTMMASTPQCMGLPLPRNQELLNLADSPSPRSQMGLSPDTAPKGTSGGLGVSLMPTPLCAPIGTKAPLRKIPNQPKKRLWKRL